MQSIKRFLKSIFLCRISPREASLEYEISEPQIPTTEDIRWHGEEADSEEAEIEYGCLPNMSKRSSNDKYDNVHIDDMIISRPKSRSRSRSNSVSPIISQTDTPLGSIIRRKVKSRSNDRIRSKDGSKSHNGSRIKRNVNNANNLKINLNKIKEVSNENELVVLSVR